MDKNSIVQLFFLTLVYDSYTTRSDEFVPVIETLYFPSNYNTTNEDCNRDIQLFATSLRNNTLWAYRMWEASAKSPLGLIEGSQYQLGNFDQCLEIEEPFSSQYCLATINIDVRNEKLIQDSSLPDYEPYMNLYKRIDHAIDLNMMDRRKLFWGVCFPASCAAKDIETELKIYLNRNHNSNIKGYQVTIRAEDCQNGKKNFGYNMDFFDYLFCYVVGLFVIVVGISTIYDCKYQREKNERVDRLLLCFSAKKNFHELGKPERNEKLRILYGLKFICIVIIISAHCISNILIGSVLNYSHMEKLSRSEYFIIARRLEIIVDIFLLIGGLLNTHGFLMQSEKKSFNSQRAIFLRYFRIIPTFAILTFFYSTLFYKIGSGPSWRRIVGRERDYCLKNWWTNLILLNNYINVTNMCAMHGWYLGADFQLFIISIPLNYLLKRNSILSWTIFTSILCGSIAILFQIVYIQQKEPIFYANYDFIYSIRDDDNFQTIYIPMHTRISTYLLGMILGSIYYQLRSSKLRISFDKSILMLIVSVTMIVMCIFSGQVFYEPHEPYNAFRAALYASLHRPIFAVAIGILMLSMSFGAIPSHLLTWNPMISLSKLSFGAYLVHFTFQLTNIGMQRVPTNITMYYLVKQVITDVVLSLLVAFFLFIFIENPCITFIKEIIPANFCRTAKKNESEK